MHDIGEVGPPDDILRERGRPTEEEWRLIRRRADWGADAPAEMRLVPAAVDGVRAHHERRWDASAYPQGLRGCEIPALGRMVALCDSYDAMTGHRRLRAATPLRLAREEPARLAGVHYDRHVIRALLAVLHGMERSDETPQPRDFAAQWRRTRAGVDPERLYMRVFAGIEDAGAGIAR